MTTAQAKRLYFPAWRTAFQHCWQADRGQLVARPGRTESLRLSVVEVFAKRRAGARAAIVGPDDLRHACHLAALGRDKSSKDMTNQDIDQVLAFFRLLVDPDDLSAQVALDNPDQEARRRLEWSVTHTGLPEAYVLKVCSQKFGTREWKTLDDEQLRQLVITLKARARARQPVPQAA